MKTGVSNLKISPFFIFSLLFMYCSANKGFLDIAITIELMTNISKQSFELLVAVADMFRVLCSAYCSDGADSIRNRLSAVLFLGSTNCLVQLLFVRKVQEVGSLIEIDETADNQVQQPIRINV